MRLGDDAAVYPQGSAFGQESGACLKEAEGKGVGLFAGQYFRCLLGQHRACVQSLVQEHQAHARFLYAVEYGGRYRGRAAVAGQQGRMYVDEAVLGDPEHFGGNEQPIGGDDDQVRRQFDKLLNRRVSF